jgi:hypothetical protein
MDCRVKPGNDEGASGGATDETRGWETRGVLRALNPRMRRFSMEARVKPGNDEGKGR